MVLITLDKESVRAVIADSIITGVSREVTSGWELASRYGYDVTGRYGAVANRFMMEGRIINTEAGYDVIAANFPHLANKDNYLK